MMPMKTLTHSLAKIGRTSALLPTSLLVLTTLAACAGNPQANGTSSNDPAAMQTLRIDVLSTNGQPINGLACRLANQHGYFLGQSGGTVSVKRSERDLDIDCDAPAGLSTRAQLRPRNNNPSGNTGSTSPVPSGSNTSVYGSVGIGSSGSRGGVGISMGFPMILGSANQPGPSASSQWRYPEWVQLRQGKTLMFDAQGSSSAQPAVGYEALRP